MQLRYNRNLILIVCLCIGENFQSGKKPSFAHSSYHKLYAFRFEVHFKKKRERVAGSTYMFAMHANDSRWR